jgi:hypothetical protein
MLKALGEKSLTQTPSEAVVLPETAETPPGP